MATQCRSQPELIELETAANGLEAVLVDPAIGGCGAGLPDGRTVVRGDGLDADTVNAAVRDAIRYAADQDATLVLAFLGHGFVPGNDPVLHYMTPDSKIEDRASAVNVATLLTEAVDSPGIGGVIAVIDTCNAAGAAVAKAGVAVGARAGRVRYELLMASAVHQEAYDLKLSRHITDLLRDGFRGGPQTLAPSAMLAALRQKISEQATVFDGYDGESGAAEQLWLARNIAFRDHNPYAATTLREVTELPDLVAAIGLPPELAERRSLSGLRDLQQQLSGTGRHVDRARAVVQGLIVAHDTAQFLNTSMPNALTSAALRRAVKIAEIANDEPVPTTDELALLTHIAVRYPMSDGDCRRQVMRFVVALAIDCGNPDWDSISAWADSINARMAFNDTKLDLAGRQLSRRLRLIISLHAREPGSDGPGRSSPGCTTATR